MRGIRNSELVCTELRGILNFYEIFTEMQIGMKCKFLVKDENIIHDNLTVFFHD